MPTLVLRNGPDDLYQRLKDTAADHRRSMTQEAIVSLRGALLGCEEPPPKLGLEDILDWLRREVWSLPVKVQTIALDETLADLAAEGYRRFGKGRHPAGQ